MAEQERIQRRKQRQKSSQHTESVAQGATSDSRYEDIEKKLSEVDAAFDDFLAASQTTATDSTIIGQQQRVVKPLSDEAFVRGFRQTSGE